MNITKIVTDFIQSGEIQTLAKQQADKEDAFTTGAIWAACRIAETAASTPLTTDLRIDRKHNLIYCGNCNEVIYEGKSSYHNLNLSFVQTKYKFCNNCGRRFKQEEVN